MLKKLTKVVITLCTTFSALNVAWLAKERDNTVELAFGVFKPKLNRIQKNRRKQRFFYDFLFNLYGFWLNLKAETQQIYL